MKPTRAQTLTALALVAPASLFGAIMALHKFAHLYSNEGPGVWFLGALFVALVWSLPVLMTAALIVAKPSGPAGQSAQRGALVIIGIIEALFGLAAIVQFVRWDDPIAGFAFVIGIPMAAVAFNSLAGGRRSLSKMREIGAGLMLGATIVVVVVAGLAGVASVVTAAHAGRLAVLIRLAPLPFFVFLIGALLLRWIIGLYGKLRGEDLVFAPGLYAAHRWLRAEDVDAAWSGELAGFPHRGEIIGVWRCKRVEDEPGGPRRWHFALHRRMCRWVPMSSERRDAELARLGVSERSGFIEAFWCRDCEDTRVDFALAEGRALVAGHVPHPQPVPALMVGMFVVFVRGLYPASDTIPSPWLSGTSSSPLPRTPP